MSKPESVQYSIIIPARNEAKALAQLLPDLVDGNPHAEILIVDDGSTDDTFELCQRFDVTVIRHPYAIGNGAAIKSGARFASGEVLVFMDGDGQHRIEDIEPLRARLDEGYDMVVGARVSGSQAGIMRAVANDVFSRFASRMVGQPIADLTSGFRVVKASQFRKFLYLLPNGFSYPTTITMCFFRAGFSVAYVPIHTPKRIGRSHIRPLRDGFRFLLIILKIGTLYSPLRVFLPVAASFFLTGVGYYGYTYYLTGRFTNMSALLFIASILTFLIGIVSEQISSLHYKGVEGDEPTG